MDFVFQLAYLVVLVAGGIFAWIGYRMNQRRRRGFESHFTVRAPRQLVWNLLVHAHGPQSWRPDVLGIEEDPGEPELFTHLCTHKGRPLAIVFRVLEAVSGEIWITRCEKVGDNPLPLGQRAFAACRLTDCPGGTRLDIREEGEFASWFALASFAIAQRCAYWRLKRQAEAESRKLRRRRSLWPRLPAGPARADTSAEVLAGLAYRTVAPGSGQLSPPWHLVAGSAIAIALITALMGWQYGVLLFTLLTIMEYGHAFALRLAGERPTIVSLLPFVGGAMAINTRRTTMADEALRALSGPASLAGLVVVLAGIGILAGDGVFADNIRMASLFAAGIVAVFLLPFYPLNGGWLFGALKSSLPNEVFIVPAVVASSIVLAWSVATGALVAALLSAALVHEMISPATGQVVADGSLTARRALAVTLAYGGLNLIAHSTIAAYIV